MINAWLDLPIAALFTVLTLFYGLAAGVMFWLAFHSPVRRGVKSLTGVVAPYFTAISILFALLTGFLAADVGGRNRQAASSIVQENNALIALDSLSRASGAAAGAVRDAARDYVAAVVNDEWRQLGSGQFSPRAAAAFEHLLAVVADPAIARDGSTSVHNSLLSAVVQLSNARAERLSLAEDRTNELKWATVLALGVLTQIAIGLVHLERPRAMAAALSLFTVAVIVAVGLIALQENPFEPPIQVSPAPLQRTLTTLSAG